MKLFFYMDHNPNNKSGVSWNTLREARRRAARRRRIAIVELHGGGAIDASVGGNEFRYTNHSCAPNAYMRIFGRHVGFYALRDIPAKR